MKPIKFDLSCFSLEFQEYVYKELECNNYFDFINKYENSFILNILNIKQDKIVNPISYKEEESNSCTFKNNTLNYTEDISIVNCEIVMSNNETCKDNIDKILSQINSEDSIEE